METTVMLRHQLIHRLVSEQAKRTVDAMIGLWVQVSTQIIAVVGIGGFDSLYARSLFLTQSKFPWLTGHRAPSEVGQRFANLKANLEDQSPELAREANCTLMTSFTDILASLIGEPLTARILDSAWGQDAFYTTGEDSKNE